MRTPEILQGEPSDILILNNPSYDQFLKSCLEPNRPCLISPELVASWKAFSLWTKKNEKDGTEEINWSYLKEAYGDQMVTVAQCLSRDFSDQERTQRPFSEVIDLWTSGEGEGLYVKDWHLAKALDQKGLPSFYETPDIFRDDWMNAFWESEGKDDFRFVYMGVAKTFTPLHRDVYTSYSWSTNGFGVKKWHLFPPSVSQHLRRFPDRTTSEIVFDVRNVDTSIFKEFHQARAQMITVIQPPGWTIFVPSGWYHQVENDTDAISINHNWCNTNNLPSVYRSLLTATHDVMDALSDVEELLRDTVANGCWQKEWMKVVQELLQKDSGWDWCTFWNMILFNIAQLDNPLKKPNSAWTPAGSHLQPDSERIRSVVRSLLSDFRANQVDLLQHTDNLPSVLDKISFLL